MYCVLNSSQMCTQKLAVTSAGEDGEHSTITVPDTHSERSASSSSNTDSGYGWSEGDPEGMSPQNGIFFSV